MILRFSDSIKLLDSTIFLECSKDSSSSGVKAALFSFLLSLATFLLCLSGFPQINFSYKGSLNSFLKKICTNFLA